MALPQQIGFPGVTRPKSNPWVAQTFSGPGPKQFVANDPNYFRPGAKPKETFLTKPKAKPAFGTKSNRALAKAALGRGILAPLGPVSLLYDAYTLGYLLGTLVELPRDWQHPSDRELTFPAGWNVTNVTLPNDDLGWRDQHHEPDHRYWVDPIIGGDASCNVTAPQHRHEYLAENFPTLMWTPQDLVDGLVTSVEEYGHLDARPLHPGWAGDTHGGARLRSIARTSGSLLPTFTNAPRTVTETVPALVPLFEPLHPPANRPIPGARPVPRPNPVGNPYQSPWEAPQVGPSPAGRPSPGPASPPELTIGVGPRPGGAPSPRPVSRPQPPGPREKERKFDVRRGGGVTQVITQAAGEVTEFLDALDAFYDALPPECKPGMYQIHAKGGGKVWVKRWNPNVQQRAAAVYKCFEHLDPTKLFQNVLKETVIDTAVGKANRAIRRLTPGRPLGLSAGPWDTAYAELAQEAKDSGNKGVDFDPFSWLP